MRVRKAAAKQKGGVGGSRFAGRGSTVKQVKEKEQWLLNSRARSGEWPSARQAWDLKRISRSVYNRVTLPRS